MEPKYIGSIDLPPVTEKITLPQTIEEIASKICRLFIFSDYFEKHLVSEILTENEFCNLLKCATLIGESRFSSVMDI